MSLQGVNLMEKPIFQEPASIKKLGALTTQIETLQKHIRQNKITDKEIEDLTRDLKLYTDEVHKEALDSKKLSFGPESEAAHQAVNERIEHALQAILAFHQTHPLKGSQKNVTDLIATLFNNLQAHMGVFEESVKNLKEKWKVYIEKIQQTGKSKES